MSINTNIENSNEVYTKEEQKEILILKLLFDFCKDKKNVSYDLLCSKLNMMGLLSDEILLLSNNSKEMVNIDNLLIPSKNNFKLINNNILPNLSRFEGQFTNKTLIGKGGYGAVFKTTHLLDKQEYAVKIIRMHQNIKSSYIILREVQSLSILSHKNIVKYHCSWLGCSDYKYEEDYCDEVYHPNIRLFIQMELCDNSLDNYIKDRKIVSNEINEKYITEILEGIKYIHNSNLIHRDIKPKNLFINQDILKIGDFGLSRTMNIKEVSKNSLIKTDDFYTSDLGSSVYSAPEQLISSSYDSRVDVYSIGIIIYELFNIFGTRMEFFKEIENITTNDIFKKNKYYNLVTKCCLKDFTKRPFSKELNLNN